jgi:hypothetical protein
MKVPAPPPATTSAPSYGPAIDIDLDIDLGTPDNPIDDINLGRISFFSILKVLTNEKRGRLKGVTFVRSPFKLFTLRFSNKSVQSLFLSFEINNCFQISV